MKRCLSIIGLALCVLLDLSAQEIRIKDFGESQEIFLGKEQRRDFDGVICALVRVVVPADSHVRFTGNVIGEAKYDGNEYRVYLSEGSRYLRVHYPGCAALLVDFQSLGYDGVESKKVYELVLGLPDGMRRTMSRSEYEQLIAQAALRQKEENFAEAISLYEERKHELIAKGEQGYVEEIQEQINYCKRRITFKQLRADSWKTVLSEGLCCYRAQGKFGFVDSIGNVVVPPIYEDVLGGYDFKDGIAWVKKDSLWGSINTRGEVVIPYTYKFIDRLKPFSYKENRCLVVSVDEYRVGVVDYKTGQEILPCDYYLPNIWISFDICPGDYFCLMNSKDRFLFFEKKTGKELFRLPPKMVFSQYLGYGCSLVRREVKINRYLKESRDGIVDGQGKFLFPCEYKDIEPLEQSRQYVVVKRECNNREDAVRNYCEECRLFNLKQRVYVGGIYNNIYDSSIIGSLPPFIAVRKNGYLYRDSWGDLRVSEPLEYGVLNYVTGEEIIKPSADISGITLPQTPEDPIVAKDKHTGEFHLHDLNGKRYASLRSEETLDYNYGYTRIKRNGKYGFANAKGEVVLDCIYDDAGYSFEKYGNMLAVEVKMGEDSFYINPSGERIEKEVIQNLSKKKRR